MMRFERTLLGMILFAFISSPTFAKQGKRFADDEYHEKHVERLVNHLDLSEEQKEKISTVSEKSRESVTTAKKALREKKEAFARALEDNKTSDENLRQLHDEVLNAKTSLMRARFENMLSIRSVLTNEQKLKFSDKKKHFGKKRFMKNEE